MNYPSLYMNINKIYGLLYLFEHFLIKLIYFNTFIFIRNNVYSKKEI